jgi:hypothetical protein
VGCLDPQNFLMGLHRLVGPGSVSEPPPGEHSIFQAPQALIKMVPPAVCEEGRERWWDGVPRVER